jgi:xanthine dehydrogenase accessory factor
VRLDAATAATLSLQAVGAGASTAAILRVTGVDAGARLLLIVDARGEERVHGGLEDPELDARALALGRTAIADPRHHDGLAKIPRAAGDAAGDGAGEAEELYVEVRRPVLDLVIVGAGHIARPMARIGSDLGYRVWVLDDRPDFATRERFPDAHQVVRADFSDPFRDVPVGAATHVLLVTRGHRYDYDCLVRVLGADPPPAYVGMIGSRRRVRATFLQLLEDGIARDRLNAIHAPVGLDIGAETPEEIAVAVAAELVKVRRGGSGASLRDMERVAERFFKETEGA